MTKFEIIQGDITQVKVDAIVNAANATLQGGGGVDGAIHYAAGPGLLQECQTLNGCQIGDAKATKGYRLPAKFVIHAVGPVWKDGAHQEKEHLRSCYRRSLQVALDYDLKSIAFPCISTGIYRFPKALAAEIAIKAVKEFVESAEGIEKVVFVCFGKEDLELYKNLLS